MKKANFGVICASLSLLIACGDQAGANKPANAPANTANANTAAAPVDAAGVEAAVKKMVGEYAAGLAKNDASEFDKVTAENFMFVGNDGSVQTKAERIEAMKSGATKYDTITYDVMNVRVNPEGTGAVVLAKATVKGMNMGKPIDGVMRITQVWSKVKDGWKLVSLQATPITAKDEKAADDRTKTDGKPANDTKSADKLESSPANK